MLYNNPVNKVISIVGLTASGKSALGIKIAKEFNGEIISADSRQVYRGLDIGSAKVTKAEQAEVKHHLLDIVEPGEKFDVYNFQQRAFAVIKDILSRGKLPIIVGGTGLYSRSVVENYKFDGGGQSPTAPEFQTLQICLMPSKEFIRPLVERRIDERLNNGMIEETQGLIDRGVSKEWLGSLGLEYFWNVEYIDGRVTLDEYKKQLATKTMQFAKRQRTWFKREKNTHFLTEPETFYAETIKLISLFLTNTTF
jgi:tRNA dimethylallyltransferase